jgi:hypothetical protein
MGLGLASSESEEGSSEPSEDGDIEAEARWGEVAGGGAAAAMGRGVVESADVGEGEMMDSVGRTQGPGSRGSGCGSC